MAQAGRCFAGLRPLFLILLLAIGAAAKADTFRWTDDRGAIHYSDQVPPEHLYILAVFNFLCFWSI